MMLVIVGLILMTVGAVLAAVGIRGQRRGSVRRCRGCDFDLTGLPEDAGACPECGRGIADGRGVVIGTRHPVPLLAFSSPALILIGLALVLSTWAWSERQATIAPRLPVWALERNAIHGDPRLRDASLAELRTRMINDALSEVQQRRLIDLALDVQGNRAPRAVWTSAWSDLLYDAKQLGMLDESDIRRHVDQAMEVRFSVRQRVIAGREVRVYQSLSGRRLWSTPPGTEPFLHAKAETEFRLTAPGEDPAFEDRLPGLPRLRTVAQGSGNNFAFEIPADTAPGVYRLHGRLPGALGRQSDVLAAGVIEIGDDGSLPPGMWRADRSFSVEIEVLEAGTDTPELFRWIRGDEITAQVRERVRLTRVESGPGGMCVRGVIDGLAAPLAFVAFVREPGRPETEHRYGQLVYRPTESGSGLGFGHGFSPPREFGESVDVVLRTCMELVYELPNLDELWVGEIVFEGVRLGEPDDSGVAPTIVREIEP